jgi:ribosomal protein S18 acetylase RimI-like enzyme
LNKDQLDKFQKMLLNERSFDRLFCDVSGTEKFDLYYNEHFSDDPVFNHAVVDDSILESTEAEDLDFLSTLLYEIKSEASTRNVPATIFVERFWNITQRLERAAVDDGYLILGSMEILSKDVGPESSASDRGIEIIETRNVRLWNDVFMRSYAISPDWESELLKRESAFLNDQATTLLLAKEQDSEFPASGCMLMHKIPSDFLGIYCVGTLPQSRNRGIASLMVRKGEEFASKIGCKYLTLQTLTYDSVTPMYQKLGFKIEFERNILQLA